MFNVSSWQIGRDDPGVKLFGLVVIVTAGIWGIGESFMYCVMFIYSDGNGILKLTGSGKCYRVNRFD